jgi:hypothetical protein
MSISIPHAEDIELPAFDAYEALLSFCHPPNDSRLRRCDIRTNAMQVFMRSITGVDEVTKLIPKIMMMTHVYYARQIDYSYLTKEGAALAANVAAAVSPLEMGTKPSVNNVQTTGASQAPPAPQSDSAVGVNGKPTASANEAQLEIQALKNQLDDMKKHLGTIGPGGTVKIISAGSKGVLMRQTFDLPVAIGFRGLWIKPEGLQQVPGSLEP